MWIIHLGLLVKVTILVIREKPLAKWRSFLHECLYYTPYLELNEVTGVFLLAFFMGVQSIFMPDSAIH